MKRRLALPLARLLCLVITIAMSVSTAIVPLTQGAQTGVLALAKELVFRFTGIVIAVVAALCVSRRPGNVIGWLLMEPAALAHWSCELIRDYSPAVLSCNGGYYSARSSS